MAKQQKVTDLTLLLSLLDHKLDDKKKINHMSKVSVLGNNLQDIRWPSCNLVFSFMHISGTQESKTIHYSKGKNS